MKKLLLILPLILFTTLPSFAYNFVADGIYYKILSSEDQTCAVTYRDTNYRSYSGDIVIPSTVTYDGKTYTVTAIGENAFYECKSLTSITLPNSLTTIGEEAFYKCTSLTSITLPNSLTTIGNGAFYKCSSLTSVTLPNSVTTIGNDAFNICERLTSITLSNSLTTIGNNPFAYCSNLKSFTGKFASDDHRCLIIDGVLNSFAPAELTTYTIPNSVTTIGNSAFSDCYNLTSITLPNSLTTIGNHAFFGCGSLPSIILPNSLTTIGRQAFAYCYNLTSIISLAITPPSVKYDTFDEVPTSTCTLKVPAESVAAYKAAEVWKKFYNITPLTEEELQALPVESISATPTLTAPAYNLRGQRVGTTYKGIVIQNRHKVILK